jgi:hypothetical protein
MHMLGSGGKLDEKSAQDAEEKHYKQNKNAP